MDMDTKCSEALKAAKRLIASVFILTHYNPELPPKLAGDVSAYGLGAVLSHVFPDGEQMICGICLMNVSTFREKLFTNQERDSLSDL